MKPNREEWLCRAAHRETALHLTYPLFVQFPSCMTVHLVSDYILRQPLNPERPEIIANPVPLSEWAKRPCTLFKISNKQTNKMFLYR